MQKEGSAHVTYTWYGQGIEVNLGRCREALVQKLLSENAPGSLQEFAKQIGLSHETVYKLFRGEQIGRRSLTVILGGLGLRPDQVIERVPAA